MVSVKKPSSVQVADIAQALQLLVGGAKVSNYEEHGEEYDVRLRSKQEYRDQTEALKLITIPSRRLGQVTLAVAATPPA